MATKCKNLPALIKDNGRDIGRDMNDIDISRLTPCQRQWLTQRVQLGTDGSKAEGM